MALTKEELLSALRGEVRLLLHLISKVEVAKLDFRPTAKQRSTLELLQYLTIMGPIHTRAIIAGAFDMGAWRTAWSSGEALAKTLNLEQIKDAVGKQSKMFEELLGAMSSSAPST